MTIEPAFTVDDLVGKRILLCTSHQDDEALFAGGLLTQLQGRAKITVACFFRPAPRRTDARTRVRSLERLCNDIGVGFIQYPYALEKDFPHLWRFMVSSKDPERLKDKARRPIHRFPLFHVLSGTIYATMMQTKADIVLTHNDIGEYGHREHILLHHAAKHATKRAQMDRMLCFGQCKDKADFTVKVDQEKKKALLAYYLPYWDGVAMYDFALDDETYYWEPLGE